MSMHSDMSSRIRYPGEAEFAFTILDDTDDTRVSNGQPVYDFLASLGFRTTKTVWALDTSPENQGPYFAGETLASSHYLEWVHKLASEGFEIAFHNATMGSSLRQDTIKALDIIKNEFGQPARLHCNHGQNTENLHWGAKRYQSILIKTVLRLWARFRSYPSFEGDDPTSDYFWSDIADQHISYIRSFTFRNLSGANLILGRPYRDAKKQSKSLFFNTTDAPDVWAFNRIINRNSIDKLYAEKGLAIVSTHLGKGYFQDGALNPEFKETMEYLASKPGWFVPTSNLLDFVVKTLGGAKSLSYPQRVKMEYLHLFDRIMGRLWDESPY